MIARPRRSGISVPLFSLRSTRSWGIGEIGDIPAFAGWLRSALQSVLQILPLNELAPEESSPYSALSAMALDPRYITVRLLDDAAELEERWLEEIDEVQRSPGILHKKVLSLKARALEACFDRFYRAEWQADTARAGSLRSFISSETWWLDEYSLYRALRRQAGEKPWMEWQPPLRDRDAAVLAGAREQLAREILFFQYVQWVASDQWQSVRKRVADVEILGDFPFMVTLDSADVWSRQSDFILDASVGTPPDAFSESGQEWGLPPYDSEAARTNDFKWLRMRARRCAELFDGFRVDHLVGFYRTYVRPFDGRPAYFLPASESEQRELGERLLRYMIDTGADISVEDLGTVPDFVRGSIARLGLPGYKVLRWEPADPLMYSPLSVAMTGTHDTESVAVWWESLSRDERLRFAALPSLSAAHPQGAIGLESPVFDGSIRDAILQGVCNAGSNLVLLPLQDAFGWRDRINQPATVGDANWTYSLPWPIDRMMNETESRECADRLAGWTHQARRWRPLVEDDD